MFTHRASVICLMILGCCGTQANQRLGLARLPQQVGIIPLILFCLLLLSSCTQSSTPPPGQPQGPSPPHRTTLAPTSPAPTGSASAATTPTINSLMILGCCAPRLIKATLISPTAAAGRDHQTQYTPHVVLSGAGRPDDLTFDRQRRLLFSDFYNGTVSRINADGSVTRILSGLAGPEGLVVLSDGTLIIAEQRTNRILSLAPGANSPTVLRVLPGTPRAEPCKDGVDGIAFDAITQTLIIPDSPTGEVYRMSLDGKTLTLLASGIVRPVGAAVARSGTIYVADECGGAVWRITTNRQTTRIGGFGMPDDVAFDQHGNLLVIDLEPAIHALIRMNLSTGRRETLASRGFIEPQGLVVDNHDDIFVSDDYADIIVEYIPR